jgi:hypothetical protein
MHDGAEARSFFLLAILERLMLTFSLQETVRWLAAWI